MVDPISRREFLRRMARWGTGIVGLGLLSSCGIPWSSWRKAASNVIIITLDTLRADHLSCYGYPRPTTPVLDRMAAQGIRFARAYSHCERTNPSHASILTGLHPRTHGVINCRMPMSPQVETLQKMLRAYDYATMAAVSIKHLGPDWGMAEGFETFYPCEEARRPGEETVDLVINWLSTRRNRPFFAWIHLFDPHWIYDPPAPYNGLYYDGDPYNPDSHSMEEAHASHGGRVSDMVGVTDIAYPVGLYDGAITYTDAQVGRILDTLRRTGQEENTLVVVTADHGEGLGEHKIYFDHFGIHQEEIHVPLIFYCPRYPWSGRIVDSLAAHVDIVPTILDSLNLPIPGHLEGYSLVPAMKGEGEARPQAIYLQMHDGYAVGLMTPRQQFIQYLQASPTPPFLFKFKENDLELYDLVTDPTERVNLVTEAGGEATQQIHQFQEALSVWRESGSSAYLQEQLELDASTEQMLKDLGY